MPIAMHLALLGALIAGGCMAAAPARLPAPPGGEARLDVDRGDGAYTVRALFDGTSGDSLSYRFRAVRTGPAGRSQTTQSGAFEAAAGRTDTLSTVRTSATPGDRIEMHLAVLHGDVTTSEAVVDETVR